MDMSVTSKLARRTMLGGGAALASVGALSYAAYRRFPLFFEQCVSEMKLPILPPPRVPHPGKWPDKGVHSAWLGHSTVLLKVDGYTVLTDPVFSDRAGIDLMLFTVGVKRMVAPALSIRQLPHVDLILVSHAHMDHLDTPSLRKLESKATEVVMASHTSDLIRPERYGRVTELGWGQRARAGAASVTAFEVRHWGARMQTDTYRGYNGYVIEINKRRIVFAGDTALTDTFRAVRAGGAVDLAIMPIGAYNPWIRVHCSPEQAWRMVNDAGAEYVLPVHHRTFHLSREPLEEPLGRLLSAAGRGAGRVALHGIGDEFHLS